MFSSIAYGGASTKFGPDLGCFSSKSLERMKGVTVEGNHQVVSIKGRVIVRQHSHNRTCVGSTNWLSHTYNTVINCPLNMIRG